MNPDFSQQNDRVRERIIDMLPLPVTTISVQKKKDNRFSLFSKKLFLIGVSSQTLLEYSIQKGILLTRDLFHDICTSEEYQAVKDRCFQLLAGRDHGSEELNRKLVNKGFSPEITEKVIEEFLHKDLLNDHTFAKKFSHEKHHLKKWGPGKIKAALFNKGVPLPVITQVLQDLHNNLDQVGICVELALKRKKHFLRETDCYKRKHKIFRYLAGRGYSPEKINNALPIIAERLDA